MLPCKELLSGRKILFILATSAASLLIGGCTEKMPPEESVSGKLYAQCKEITNLFTTLGGKRLNRGAEFKCKCVAKVSWKYEKQNGIIGLSTQEAKGEIERRCRL